ncbi:ATP-binding protein [Limosilactobacillus difficilis]|uniref:ATP-binding protein n=1 Tax=Limosilactobacillus difficilis TaxID=2991838 RepID=UPI0024B92164|nr:ATP-binding protein [Limosilactobacillus difficilis]
MAAAEKKQQNPEHKIGDNLSRLHIIHNSQDEMMSISELFDSNRYSQLIAVCGTIDPDFINKYLADFVQLDLVIANQAPEQGNSKAELSTKVALVEAMRKIADKQPAKVFESLTSQLQLAVLGGVLKIEMAPTQVINSRFYLLNNPTSNEHRLIVTSANLTKQSFTDNQNRFEEVLVFDNQSLYDNMMVHFKVDLKPVLVPFFSEELLKAAQKQLTAMHKDNAGKDSLVILDNQTTDAIAEDGLTDLLSKQLQEQLSEHIVTPNFTRDMRDVTMNRTASKDRERRRIQQDDLLMQLQKESVSPRAAHPKLKNRQQIMKNVHNALKSPLTAEEQAVEKKYKTFLYDRPLERNLARKTTGLFVPNDTSSYPLPFGKLATTTEIRDSLHSIDSVMKGYQQFVVDYTPEYGKRFFEAILYSFTAPFMWEIRQKTSLNPEDGNDVPNFLVLGATAGSGKSTLLRVINQLTWNSDQSLIDFGTIYPNGTNQRKAKTVQALESYMKKGSTYPVLVDEIEPYFFQQAQYSRHLVVDTMNEVVNHPRPIAPMIGTTNYSSGFTMLRETARRTYYLQIDKVIDEKKKGEANKYIFNVRQTLNNRLFKDFVVRMAEKLENDQTPWRIFNNQTGRLDFLANTRLIFKDYYQMAGMAVPDYFADAVCDDFRESARSKWAKLYITQPNDFLYRKEKDSLLFDMAKLNTFNGFGGENSMEEYRNALPVEICVDGVNGKTGKFVEIKCPDFFRWIGEPNPHTSEQNDNHESEESESPKHKGFFARLFG